MFVRTVSTCCLAVLVIAPFAGCARPSPAAAIYTVLDRQVADWNNGDIDSFMHGYWKSDELTFTTPTGTTRGWQATSDRYRARYKTKEQMGRLQFDSLCVKTKDKDTAEVTGIYRQQVGDKTHSGRFTLQMRRIDGAWVIASDHTIPD